MLGTALRKGLRLCVGAAPALAAALAAGSAHAAGPALHQIRLSVPAAERSGSFATARTLTVPDGWRAEVWALVPGARLAAWAPNGSLLVSSPQDGRVYELTPRPGARAAAPAQRVLLSGLNLPQGLAFDHVDGREVLYVAETDQIDRFVWRAGGVGARKVLIPNLPSGSDHDLKNVVVDAAHNIFFDIGSSSNASPPSPSDPPWASVMQYARGGRRIRVWSTGVRNGDGLSFAPDGSLWSAVNERDDIAYPFHRPYGGSGDAYGRIIPGYVANHPPDEVARLTPGRNLGWPFCNPDPDLHPGAAGSPLAYANLRFDDDLQTNPGSSRLNCAKLPRLNRGIPAHSAPLGFHFLEASALPTQWRAGAVLAAHGSWDREPPRAPGVLWMPWQPRAGTLGAAVTIVGGFQYADGSRWGRPVDALPGPDGALYVTDDAAGAVYRIVPR